jgi:hypothetical protein
MGPTDNEAISVEEPFDISRGSYHRYLGLWTSLFSIESFSLHNKRGIGLVSNDHIEQFQEVLFDGITKSFLTLWNSLNFNLDEKDADNEVVSMFDMPLSDLASGNTSDFKKYFLTKTQ